MSNSDRDLVIALAGMFQATGQVQSLARDGKIDHDALEPLLNSLFKIDADDSEDVYGGVHRLARGLHLLENQLRQPKDMETTRYTLSLLVLERKLSKQPRLLLQIRENLDQAAQALRDFSPTHENIIARLAETYTRTISTLKPRIMVNGAHQHLGNPANANLIRALLLAGIRAAVLWRQKGGGRLTLLLKRKALLAATQRLLADLDHTVAAHGDV